MVVLKGRSSKEGLLSLENMLGSSSPYSKWIGKERDGRIMAYASVDVLVEERSERLSFLGEGREEKEERPPMLICGRVLQWWGYSTWRDDDSSLSSSCGL